MLSEEASQGISEDLDRLTKQLEASEFKRDLLQNIAKDLKQRLDDLFTGQYETLQEVKRQLKVGDSERSDLRAWYKDAEKRLDRIEDAVKHHADHMQGQVKL